MKTSVIITALLFTQVSASFFDVFQGAVLSVQNSFGKLLSDVVTDVKDTVDCTILAVEHVLSLSEDATIRYYDKCGQGTNQTTQNDPKQSESLPKMEVSIKFPPSEEYFQKIIPAEIDARINETLSKVLEDYKPHNNLLSIENVLAKESEQLADVSDLVKKEMKKLSNEVTADLEHIKQRDSGPSVDTILEEIKVLEKSEQNARNASEAVEIHQVIDEVLDKLDAIEATEANENDKLEEILRDLENNSNNSFLGLRQQFEEWKKEESRHLSEIKDKIEEHEKIYNHTNKVYDSNHTQIVLLSKDKQNDTSEPLILSQGILTVQVSKAKDVTTRRITNADVTENPNESGWSQNSKSTTVDGTNKSVTTNRSPTTKTKSSNKLPIDTSVRTLETLMLLRSDRTTTSTQHLDPNDIIITSTSNYPPIIENTTDNKPIQLETSTDSSREDLATVKAVDNGTDSSNTDVVTGNTLENVTSQNTDGVIGSTTEDFAITTEITTTVANNISATSTLTPETLSIEATVTTTPLFEEPTTFISNKSMISNVSGLSTSVETTTISEVFANTSPSKSEEPSKLITDSPTSPAKVFVTESNTNPTSSSSITESTVTPEMLQSVITTTTTAVQTAENTEIQSVKNTTRSEEEKPSHIATTLSIDSNASFITSTSKITEIMTTTNEETTQLPTETVTVVIEHENTTLSEGPNLNKNGVTTTTTPISERTLSTENLPSAKNTTPTHKEFSTLTLSDSSYTTNAITSTLPPPAEKTPSAALSKSENTPSVENDVSTLPIVNNLDHIATSTEFTAIMSKTTTENIKTVETTIVSETQKPTDLTTNDIVTSSTVFSPPKENPLLSEVISIESTTASNVEKGLHKTDEILLRTTPKIITNHNITISSPPFMVTDGPPIINKVSLIDHPMIPVNNPWLTPKSVEKANTNIISQQNYNMPRIPKIRNDLPQSLTGGLLDTRWPLYDPHQVNNAPQKFGIPNGSFPPQFQNPKFQDYHGRKSDFIKNRFSDVGATPSPVNPALTQGLIPTVPKQQPQVEISAHDQAVFDEFDSMSDSGWPSSSMDEILNLAEMPIAPEKKSTPSPRVPTDRGRINAPGRPLQSPYNRPPGLTTNRPQNNARIDDSQNMPVDYDSFFHIPQKNTEAHQRALKDAQQLIANSQLSNRIIDRVLRSKNTVGARSIFNNPRTLNSGK